MSDVDLQLVEQFWTWFAYHAPSLTFPPPEEIIHQVGDALRAIDPELSFQIGHGDDGFVIEISADGRKRLIPAVVEIVAAAPDIAGWRVKAFRQPFDLGAVSIGGRHYTADNVEFAIKRDEQGTHVALFLDGFAASPNDVAPIAFLLLDATLGELSVMTEITGLNFFDRGQRFTPTRPLRELRAALDS